MEIVASESANWQRVEARAFVTNWLSADIGFDAIMANNDEMAIAANFGKKASTNLGDVQASSSFRGRSKPYLTLPESII